MKPKLLVLRKLLNYSKSLMTILKCKGHVCSRLLQNQLVCISYRERGKKSKFLGKKKIESQPEIQPLYLSHVLGTELVSLSSGATLLSSVHPLS